MKKEIKGVLFDLDGTLANTLEDLSRSMNSMLAHFGFPKRNTEQIIDAICYGQREFVIRSLPEEHRTDVLLIDKCQAYYAEVYNGCDNLLTHPYDGIPEALRALSEREIRLAVVTNKAQNHADAVIGKIFDEGIFDTVIGGLSGYAPKPDPSSALGAAQIMNVDANECVFVGDSDVDIFTGKNAGMLTLGVSWGYRSRQVLEEAGADLVADTPGQMLEILLSLC